MTIKIYKPSKTAMQSGFGNTKKWLAEYISDQETLKDNLMGWNSSVDTNTQIKVFFDSKKQAIEWAKNNNYHYYVEDPKIRKIKIKSYSSNFAMNRKESWTH
jgi:NADH dehydrogenase